MTPSERAVAQYIVSNQTSVVYLTARELAEAAGVSDATVVRFAQSLGFSGYKDMKLRIALAAQATEPFAESADASVSARSKVDAAYDRAVAAIRNTQANLPLSTLTQVVAYLTSARCIYVLGTGTSGVVARDAYIKFTRLGMAALHDEDPHSMAAALAVCQADDVAMAFSHSGNTVEVVRLLEIARANGARIIAVTNNSNSRVATLADHILLTGSDELPFHTFAMTSRIAQLVVVDALVTLIIAEQGDRGTKLRARIAERMSEFIDRAPRWPIRHAGEVEPWQRC